MQIFIPAIIILIVTLPFWLPAKVIQVREYIFQRINGDEGIPIPGKEIGIERFKEVYSNKHVSGRSQGAGLSNLFWYWLSPGPELHQEHLEDGPQYEALSEVTKQILNISKEETLKKVNHSARKILEDIAKVKRWRLIRLKDWFVPFWADYYFNLVFDEDCPKQARRLLCRNANNVSSALKACSLRKMDTRNELTTYLMEKLKSKKCRAIFPESFTLEQQALFLQGVFFNTAVVQMSDAMAHVFLALARHQKVQRKLGNDINDSKYLVHVIDETLRLYPLFGIAHRITKEKIQSVGEPPICKGSVLLFNYPAYHQHGFEDPDKFDPDRWEKIVRNEANFAPFGFQANRPCPARKMALITMRETTKSVLQENKFYTSVGHTRSMPNRAPVLIVNRTIKIPALIKYTVLGWILCRDKWEDVFRSLKQLFLGTFMVWHAKQLKLTDRYFDNQIKISHGSTN